MLTRDQNIVDIGFQVVWNIEDPSKFLFNLADPADTMRAVSESAMRDIIARSELAPILNRDRGAIATDLRAAVQGTLDTYDAGLNVIRVNFEKADPPREVIDAFRAVQAAQQERDRLEKEADKLKKSVRLNLPKSPKRNFLFPAPRCGGRSCSSRSLGARHGWSSATNWARCRRPGLWPIA